MALHSGFEKPRQSGTVMVLHSEHQGPGAESPTCAPTPRFLTWASGASYKMMAFAFKLSLPLKNFDIHLCASLARETEPQLVHTPAAYPTTTPQRSLRHNLDKHCLTRRTFAQSFLPLTFGGLSPGNTSMELDATNLISADLEVGLPIAPIALESKRIFATERCSFLL